VVWYGVSPDWNGYNSENKNNHSNSNNRMMWDQYSLSFLPSKQTHHHRQCYCTTVRHTNSDQNQNKNRTRTRTIIWILGIRICGFVFFFRRREGREWMSEWMSSRCIRHPSYCTWYFIPSDESPSETSQSMMLLMLMILYMLISCAPALLLSGALFTNKMNHKI